MTDARAGIANLCDRFEGIDIMCRRSAGWPEPWRARLVCAKNERDDYRITVFGQSQIEVEELMIRAVHLVDEKIK